MITPNKNVIRFLRASSQENPDLMLARLEEFSSLGFETIYEPLPVEESWRYTASSIKARSESLNRALLAQDESTLWCARGGYGASDLLERIPYQLLRSVREKLLVGFSDVSALHAALFSQLGWKGLHAPMPASNLWGQQGRMDLDATLSIIKKERQGATIALEPCGENTASPRLPLRGWLFGGCLSVLTALIGTPFFPKSLRGAILFLEDIDESPPRIMRMLNQWQQSGALQQVQAVILGEMIMSRPRDPEGERILYQEISRRIELPLFRCKLLGHVSPNYPFGIGANAEVQAHQLTWSWGRSPLQKDQIT